MSIQDILLSEGLDNLLEAIREIPERDMKNLFKKLKQQEFDKILGTEDSGLTEIKHRVKLLTDLEQGLSPLHRHPAKS